ncbi:putative UDP-arabinopyranose mutase 5 [Acorus calamus]|uniref:UDP-arabinopyranose mutase 5 n=1 Tax=Acorus calamus TaxID=4465 RepID=A0AAV9D3G5_ACOCL|nr:putative UDP-arabinopyranose mutase 5 [Acorus calamus]
MSQIIEDSEVDIVIRALRRKIFCRFHLIVVKDPDFEENLQIPPGFDYHVYTKSDMVQILGSTTTAISFSGHSCWYFGYLVSHKKYIVSIDDDCILARDDQGHLIDVVAQHISNLIQPATPFFFNTLYDPYRNGSDFMRGYPFRLRSGVNYVLSCGLWLNPADYGAPTQAVKPDERNHCYIDVVLTVPTQAMMPVSGINIGFNREVMGLALFPGLRLSREGKIRWETMEDIWCGMCAKVVCDHLGLGVKSCLPYVWRGDSGDALESVKRDGKG